MTNTPAPGTPIWFDLPTPDREAGKEFYSSVFGWGWREFTSDVLGTYSLATLHGRDVAALVDTEFTARPDDGTRLWRVFYWSDDIDQTAADCESAGGTLLRGKHQHGDLGESIECTTHEGVPFVVWNGRDSLGGAPTGDVGTPSWAEYYTRDTEASYRYFDSVLGLSMRELELKLDSTGDVSYSYHVMSTSDGSDVGGMMHMGEEWGDLASHLMTYFAVEDCDATSKLVGDNGGRVCVPPTDIPSGRFSVLEDPQGGTFSAIAMDAGWQPPS